MPSSTSSSPLPQQLPPPNIQGITTRQSPLTTAEPDPSPTQPYNKEQDTASSEEAAGVSSLAQLNKTIARLAVAQMQPVISESPFDVGMRRAELKRIMGVRKGRRGGAKKRGARGRERVKGALGKKDEIKGSTKDDIDEYEREQVGGEGPGKGQDDEDRGEEKEGQVFEDGIKDEDRIGPEECSKPANVEVREQVLTGSAMEEGHTGLENLQKAERDIKKPKQKTQNDFKNLIPGVDNISTGNNSIKDGKLSDTIPKPDTSQPFPLYDNWVRTNFDSILDMIARDSPGVLPHNLAFDFLRFTAKTASEEGFDEARFKTDAEDFLLAPEGESLSSMMACKAEEILRLVGSQMGDGDAGMGSREGEGEDKAGAGAGAGVDDEDVGKKEVNVKVEVIRAKDSRKGREGVQQDNKKRRDGLKDDSVSKEKLSKPDLSISELLAILNEGIERMLEMAEERERNIGKMLGELRKAMAELDSMQG